MKRLFPVPSSVLLGLVFRDLRDSCLNINLSHDLDSFHVAGAAHERDGLYTGESRCNNHLAETQAEPTQASYSGKPL